MGAAPALGLSPLGPRCCLVWGVTELEGGWEQQPARLVPTATAVLPAPTVLSCGHAGSRQREGGWGDTGSLLRQHSQTGTRVDTYSPCQPAAPAASPLALPHTSRCGRLVCGRRWWPAPVSHPCLQVLDSCHSVPLCSYIFSDVTATSTPAGL